jgi:hypothetical protein
MATATIISATIITLRGSNARVCAECLRPITVRALRVAEKQDGFHGHTVNVYYFHPEIDREDEIRGCAPDNAMTRKALAPRRAVLEGAT